MINFIRNLFLPDDYKNVLEDYKVHMNNWKSSVVYYQTSSTKNALLTENLTYKNEIRKLNEAILRKNYTIEKLKEKVRNGDTTLRSDVNSTGSKLMKKKSTKTVVRK